MNLKVGGHFSFTGEQSIPDMPDLSSVEVAAQKCIDSSVPVQVAKEAVGKVTKAAGGAAKRATKGAIEGTKRGAQDAGRAVEQVAGGIAQVERKYVAERSSRIVEGMRKAYGGDVGGAAMDAFQFSSPGSLVGDAAKALGVVDGEVGKNIISAACNVAFGGPLGALAAVGDIQDAAKAVLGKLMPEFGNLGEMPMPLVVAMCPSQWVMSPQMRIDAGLQIGGFAKGGSSVDGEISLRGLLGNGEFRAGLQAHADLGGLLGGFAHSLPAIADGLSNAGADNGAGNSGELASILRDPKLSFEDKLFYFMCAVAKNQEQKVTAMMKKYDVAAARRKDEEKLKQQIGQLQSAIGMIGGIASLSFPPASMIAQQASQAFGGIPEMLKSINTLTDGLKASGGDTSGLTKEQSEWSEQRWMMELQKLQEELSKMYTMVSNLMKSFNETQMTAIRNMR